MKCNDFRLNSEHVILDNYTYYISYIYNIILLYPVYKFIITM